MKILNLYSGIGGNRKLWENADITAIELNREIAEIYQDYFPDDELIITDAHQYLLEHYKEYDFIWSSPPCPSHSDIRRCGVHRGLYEAIYPDRKLWEEIILLKTFAKCKWVVENVKTYYKPFIDPNVILDRHYLWANFYIKSNIKFPKRKALHKKINSDSEIFGFDLKKYSIKNKRQILRNLVNPELGKYIFDSFLSAKNNKKLKLAI